MNIDSTQITKKFQLQNCYLKDRNGQIINSGEFIIFKSLPLPHGGVYCIEYVKFHNNMHVIMYNLGESYGFKVHYLNNSDIINSDIVKLDNDEFESKLLYLKKPWKLFHLQRGIQIRSTWSEFPVLLCKNLFFCGLSFDNRNFYNNYSDYNQWKNNINFSKYSYVAALAKQNSNHLEVIFRQY